MLPYSELKSLGKLLGDDLVFTKNAELSKEDLVNTRQFRDIFKESDMDRIYSRD